MTKKKLLLTAKTLKIKLIVQKHKLNNEKIANSNISKALFMPNKFLNEFYDIPYTYNETTVKVLAQNPTTLFVYWDISDNHRQYVLEKYGQDFFHKTKPILLVKNETTNDCFEIEINDFANNWYINVPDTKCKYRIELLRKSIEEQQSDYIYMASSNLIEAPNDHVLLERLPRNVVFYDIKSKNSFVRNINWENEEDSYINNIYSLYKDIKKEDFLRKPSSLEFVN